MKKLPLILAVILSSVAVIIFLLVMLKPTAVSRENSVTINATVSDVTEGGLKDIIITLDGIRGIHYINKRAEKGLQIDSLNKYLKNKKVIISYRKPSVLARLNPMTDKRQIVELKLEQKIIYSEFQ